MDRGIHMVRARINAMINMEMEDVAGRRGFVLF